MSAREIEYGKEAFERILACCVDRIEAGELRARLDQARQEQRPLRVKFGMDPSSADLHVGHAIALRKLRQIQELGHKLVLIVGDSTAMVGDPSGRNKLRPQLTRQEVEQNLVTYTDQAAKLVDLSRAEVRRNSEWFDAMRFEDVLRLASKMTVARMLERDTFQKRVQDNEPIGIHEFLYPLMQGWDSVEIRCDIEFGGTDQLFNLLVGRELQRVQGQLPQVCLTLPLINGLDGRKMSKSYGNAILLTDAPNDVFGKTMGLKDEVMAVWFELLTDVPADERQALLSGGFREAKARLAEEITSLVHGREAAVAARQHFDRVFRDRELPAEIPLVEYAHPWPAGGLPLSILLRELGLAESSSQARRLVEGGGVKLDGEICRDANQVVLRPTIPLLVQVGKRRYLRLVAK